MYRLIVYGRQDNKVILDNESFDYLMSLHNKQIRKFNKVLKLDDKHRLIEFLKEYANLCETYKLGLVGCECCGSPMIWDSLNNKYLLVNVNYENELKTDYGDLYETIDEIKENL